MFEKIRNGFFKELANAKTRLMQFQQPIKYLILGYLAIVFIFVVSYYGFWFYLSITEKIQLPDLLAMIKELVGPAMVGFISFIAGCFVDLNGNGIPDTFEKEEKK